MARNWLIALAFAGAAAPVVAAPLSVRVSDMAGKPVRDAVVRLYAPATPSQSLRQNAHFVISQQNLQFHPFLTIIPVGADVSFPNLDPTKHHVYSFSPAKKFELKLFAKDQSRTVHFDKPGVVALGCNIHDQMSAFIVVTDTAWTARTNGQGIATFDNAPDAPSRVVVWHPLLRAPGGEVHQEIAAAQRTMSFKVRLRPPAVQMPMADY